MRLLAVVCAGVSARVPAAATDARNCRREISALVITSPNFQDSEALERIAIALYCQHRINRRAYPVDRMDPRDFSCRLCEGVLYGRCYGADSRAGSRFRFGRYVFRARSPQARWEIGWTVITNPSNSRRR